MLRIGFASLAFTVVSVSCTGSQSAKAPRSAHAEPPHASQSEDHEGGYLAGISAVPVVPVIPQCREQRNAPAQQLAPSYFEEMLPCVGKFPPQLAAAGAGHLDENGDCNLGTSGSTEVVCHYHTSYEFTSKTLVPRDAKEIVEVHCISFALEQGKRLPTPIVFGTQLSCRPSTKPSGLHQPASGHDSHASACGKHLPQLFAHTDTCDLRCCRQGTLTKANPGLGVRPDFAICAAPQLDVDCSTVLAGMHAHPPHRPHDRIGPDAVYGAPAAKATAVTPPRKVPKHHDRRPEPEPARPVSFDPAW